jgi:hypothetical protein
MGRRNKEKERKSAAAEQAVVTFLRSRPRVVPKPIESFAAFSSQRQSLVNRYRSHFLRDPDDWCCKIKSRSEDRRFVELVRFVFAKYPAASHLEQTWIAHAAEPDNWPDFRLWHIATARGDSLYKKCAKEYLSRTEAHHFVAATNLELRSAFVYAYVRAATSEANARRIAKSRIAAHVANAAFRSGFWRDAACYFARHPTSIAEISDLADFFAARRERDEEFSLKGRSLAALRKRMEEWHRELHKAQTICGGSWQGIPIADCEFYGGSTDKMTRWIFRQIKTGNDLFREGQRQRHCVAAYKSQCMSGVTSIWSLQYEHPIGLVHKGVTIELDATTMEIVQVRGFANRLPYANEQATIQAWAKQNGLGYDIDNVW